MLCWQSTRHVEKPRCDACMLCPCQPTRRTTLNAAASQYTFIVPRAAGFAYAMYSPYVSTVPHLFTTHVTPHPASMQHQSPVQHNLLPNLIHQPMPTGCDDVGGAESGHPPEVIGTRGQINEAQISPAADVWGLACLLYRLLVNTALFGINSLQAVRLAGARQAVLSYDEQHDVVMDQHAEWVSSIHHFSAPLTQHSTCIARVAQGSLPWPHLARTRRGLTAIVPAAASVCQPVFVVYYQSSSYWLNLSNVQQGSPCSDPCQSCHESTRVS